MSGGAARFTQANIKRALGAAAAQRKRMGTPCIIDQFPDGRDEPVAGGLPPGDHRTWPEMVAAPQG